MFRKGFRPRSDGKSHLLFGAVIGVVSGYYIFRQNVDPSATSPPTVPSSNTSSTTEK